MTSAQIEADPLFAEAVPSVEGCAASLVEAPLPPALDNSRGSAISQSAHELAHILHMQVPIIVKLAERDLLVASVLKLNIGSILEFNRPVDAEMELLVNNRVIGKGMPVKVGENFGLRLTCVGNLEKTIKALGAE